jgi:penicillin-binding protein 1A
MDDVGGRPRHDYGYDGVEFDPEDEAAYAPAPRRRFFTFRRLLTGVAILAVLFVLLVGWLSWRLPVGRALEPLASPALVLVSADGHPFARRGALKDKPVDVAALPAHVPAAFVAIEDRRFYRHFGVDLVGVG